MQRRAVPLLNEQSYSEPIHLTTSHVPWETLAPWPTFAMKVYNDTERFLGTAIVARDMLNTVDALHEDGMLRYWGKSVVVHKNTANSVLGISYGTTLGATFASMFPDRVDKMVLDAVVENTDYMNGT